ncbi:MAG: DNA-3-methyladenine glycosylase [Anaerolineales bacterium]|nr:DNA-3-methyladenine glycosylase [Anaerolineales bacterium]
MARLPRSFFARDTVAVARALLGQRLVHRLPDGARLAGLITETEAYVGEADLACHARAGRTARTAVMYGRPGLAYVYFIYGNHWCLNVVTERAGFPAAVLIRALQPAEGLDVIERHRAGRPARHWADGPGKLTEALAIGRPANGADLCARAARLFLERAPAPPAAEISAGPRVGIDSAPEPWRSLAWNFRWTPAGPQRARPVGV